MATDRDSASVLAMGTAFELAMAIFFDLAVIRIQALRGETLESMRERHFNLE
jgi:D-arabinose 5-phosphate isomerase GutQ